MQRRLIIAGLAAALAAPVAAIRPAAAAILFTCDSVTGSAVFAPGLVHDERAQSLSSGPTAPAGPAELTLVTNENGDAPNFGAYEGSLSADGKLVAVSSASTNLDPSDTEGIDIYVKNLDTGDIVLVSTSDTGVKGNGGSFYLTISADGSRVAFMSTATNLDPADADANWDVYVKDLASGDLMLASTSDTGVKGNGEVKIGQFLSLSADGTRVVFTSSATNLDPLDIDANDDVYVKNVNTGDIDLISTSDLGVKATGPSYGGARLSADGRVVTFTSLATNLDPADTDGEADVYVKDRVSGDIRLASTSDTGVKGNGGSAVGAISPDGTKVAFGSSATNLDPADTTSTESDTYLKNLTTGDIVLASTSDTGVKGNKHSFPGAVSPDGTKVVFVSRSTNLDPTDTDTYPQDHVYMKNLITGDLTMVSTSDAGVKGNEKSVGASASADLTRVAFSTLSWNLDPADPTTDTDVYVKDLPATPTSIVIGGCSTGQTGTASVIDIRSYGPRPLGCPVSLGGAAGNDYPDTTPILVGATVSMTIDWASGPNSYGVAAAKAGPTGTQWRFRLTITASPGHDTPATNQYLPTAGSGFTKTRLQGKLDVSALDSFNCASGIADPLSWLNLANNGSWVAKTS